MTFRIAVLGDLNNDLLLTVDGYPEIGGEALASQQRSQLGGSASNTAIMLQLLGAQSRLVACVGRDAAGDTAVEVLGELGVDTSSIVRSEDEPTSTNVVILTPGGERTMLAYRGASAVLAEQNISDAALEGVDWLHLSGYALLRDPQRGAALRAVELARERGVRLSMDVPTVQWQSAPESILEVAPKLALLLISERGAASIVSEPRELVAAGCEVVALKRGSLGCRILTSADDITVPAEKVEVVDTTGAGDSFAAGAILSVLDGEDPAGIGRRANVAGARAAATHGAGQSLRVD